MPSGSVDVAQAIGSAWKNTPRVEIAYASVAIRPSGARNDGDSARSCWGKG